jgi:hypothetical protein
MDSVIDAAFIAAGSTVVVAAVGYITNWRTTTKTLSAARSDHIWDRQAMVYEEILADTVARRVRRDNAIRTIKFDPATEAEIRARITPSENIEWYAFEGRVLAVTSAEVHAAFEDARDAHLEVLAAIGAKQDAADENRRHMEVSPGVPPPVDIGALSKRIRELQDAANAADDRLTELIRQDLLAGPTHRLRGPVVRTSRTRMALVSKHQVAIPESSDTGTG